jgi:short-subunit dehydrogenase involved in D-alanine esterification of teichoic acids
VWVTRRDKNLVIIVREWLDTVAEVSDILDRPRLERVQRQARKAFHRLASVIAAAIDRGAIDNADFIAEVTAMSDEIRELI